MISLCMQVTGPVVGSQRVNSRTLTNETTYQLRDDLGSPMSPMVFKLRKVGPPPSQVTLTLHPHPSVTNPPLNRWARRRPRSTPVTRSTRG